MEWPLSRSMLLVSWIMSTACALQLISCLICLPSEVFTTRKLLLETKFFEKQTYKKFDKESWSEHFWQTKLNSGRRKVVYCGAGPATYHCTLRIQRHQRRHLHPQIDRALSVLFPVCSHTRACLWEVAARLSAPRSLRSFEGQTEVLLIPWCASAISDYTHLLLRRLLNLRELLSCWTHVPLKRSYTQWVENWTILLFQPNYFFTHLFQKISKKTGYCSQETLVYFWGYSCFKKSNSFWNAILRWDLHKQATYTSGLPTRNFQSSLQSKPRLHWGTLLVPTREKKSVYVRCLLIS